MNNSVDILNELREISPLLAGLEKKNVFRVPKDYFENLSERLSAYAMLNISDDVDFSKGNVQKVPEGYFDNLSTNILAKIKQLYPESMRDQEEQLTGVLTSLKNVNVFSVPEGYFESLAQSIVNNTKSPGGESAVQETKEISELLYSLKNKNVFSVPDKYFTSLPGNILSRIEIANIETGDEAIPLSPLLQSLKDKNVFSVPEGYFNSLEQNILSKTKAENVDFNDNEIKTLSPLLASLKDKNVFTIPEDYFETFAASVLHAIRPVQAKVINMQYRRSWLKIAAAAVVTGAIAITSLQIFNDSSNNNNTTGAVTASVQMPDYIKESFKFKTEGEVDAGIAKLSDDDIVKYLEKNGNVLDNDLLLKNTDVSELPTQQDYLEDENTLNLYLDKIEKAAGSN